MVNKESKGKESIFMGFLTGDIVSRYGLKKSIELEKISNQTMKNGITFCPFNINDIGNASILEIFALINEHDKTFVLKKNEIVEMSLNKINHSKVLL